MTMFEIDARSVLCEPEPDANYVVVGDDLAIADHFRATISLPDSRMPVYSLRVRIEGGRPVCVDFGAARPPGGPALTAETIRVPLGRYVEEATARMVFAFTREPSLGLGKRVVIEDAPAWFSKDGAAQPRVSSGREWARERRGRGIPIDRELLERVSATYRQALARGQRPTKAVMETEHVARATASRWVARAREVGLLGPARPGSAGEITEQED